ncbi:hypothetical protein ACIRVK_41305 [Streptomyces sp. NPDC101152]|uniref:hypothetical protein n=1 Tax=Streptomyces sp. NPDC101152 TaxID=3366116 RepID=UPI0038063671
MAAALPAAALIVAVPFVGSASAGASVPSPALEEKVASGARAHNITDPHLIQVQRQQDTLDKIAGKLADGLSEFERARIPGFTDVAIDPDHNHIRLYWNGIVPARVRTILAHLPAGVTADVRSAKYSKAELHAARKKLLQGGKFKEIHLASTGDAIRITSVGPAVDGSGLEIGYDEDRGVGKRDLTDPLARKSRVERSLEVKAVTDHLTGINTSTVYKSLVADASRVHDQSPWFGGDALRNPTGGICSSGFAIKTQQGTPMLTSARHCDGGNGQWKTYVGGDLVGVSDPLRSDVADDVVAISLYSKQAGGFLFDGAANRTDGYSKAVTGWGHNNVGDYVCTDGANGGVHCNVQIAKTDISVTGADGNLRPITDLGFATQYTPDGVAAVNGDSGGPVFAGVNNYTTDEARGTITALDTTVTCPSSLNQNTVLDGHVRTPWCLKGAYWVPIYQTLSDMGWSLITN